MDLLHQEYDKSESEEDGKTTPAAGSPKSKFQTTEKKQNLKKCAACKMMISTDQFSISQIGKGKTGRCKACVTNSQPQKRKSKVPDKHTAKPQAQQQPKKRKMSLTLEVVGVFGRITIQANRDGTIEDIKKLIFSKTGCPPNQLTLGLYGRKLLKHKLVRDYNINPGVQLHMKIGWIRKRIDTVYYLPSSESLISRIQRQREHLGHGFEHYPFAPMDKVDPESLVGLYNIVYEDGEDNVHHNFGKPIPLIKNEERRDLRYPFANHESLIMPECPSKLQELRSIKIPKPVESLLPDGDDKGFITGSSMFSDCAPATFVVDDGSKRDVQFTTVRTITKKTIVYEKINNCDLFSKAFKDESQYVSVSVQIEEEDERSSEEEEEEEEREKKTMNASILVVNNRFALSRNDIGEEFGVMLASKGDELMQEYASAPTKSWICNHLHFPGDVAKKIWSFWRIEPPPCLFVEKGDILFSVMFFHYGTYSDTYAIARKDEAKTKVMLSSK